METLQRVNWAQWAADMQRPSERPAAEFLACTAIIANVAHFSPSGPTAYQPPWLDQYAGQDLETMRKAMIEDRARYEALSHWRQHVTDLESRNAGKLAAIWHALVKLEQHTPDPHEGTLVSGLRAELTELLISRWGITGPVPEDWRTEASKRTRRYDLLPKRWRYL